VTTKPSSLPLWMYSISIGVAGKLHAQPAGGVGLVTWRADVTGTDGWHNWVSQLPIVEYPVSKMKRS
jgi:hypothetical protein